MPAFAFLLGTLSVQLAGAQLALCPQSGAGSLVRSVEDFAPALT